MAPDAKKVYFIKTHKTASSSLCALLHELAARKRESMFVPPFSWHAGHHWLRSSHLLTVALERAHIACQLPFHFWVNHVSYDAWLHARMAPCHVVTILRHPVSAFESAWNYYGYGSRLGLKINEFVAKCARDESYAQKHADLINMMSHDICGTSLSYEQMLDKLQDDSWLFLLCEQFNRSVLLLEATCPSCEGVAELHAAAYPVRFKEQPKTDVLTDESKRTFLTLCTHDLQLYERAVERFEERCAAAGVPARADLTKPERPVELLDNMEWVQGYWTQQKTAATALLRWLTASKLTKALERRASLRALLLPVFVLDGLARRSSLLRGIWSLLK